MVLAMGRPNVTRPPPSPRSAVVDQIVVSVGPYMFRMRARVRSRSSASRAGGSASPPSISVCSPPMARAAVGSATSSRAMLGVHCRCVTLWRRTCAAMEKSSRAGPASAFTRATTSASGRSASSTVAVGMP